MLGNRKEEMAVERQHSWVKALMSSAQFLGPKWKKITQYHGLSSDLEYTNLTNEQRRRRRRAGSLLMRPCSLYCSYRLQPGGLWVPSGHS